MRPPSWLYFEALPSRFTNTCSSRSGSASVQSGIRRQREVEVLMPMITRARTASAARASTWTRSSRVRRISILAIVIRETSMRSSIKVSS